MTRKIIALLTCAILLSVFSLDTNAAVFYNETTGRYISTSGEDGCLAFGGTVYNPDGTIKGSDGQGRYLENMVPTITPIKNEKEISVELGLASRGKESGRIEFSATKCEVPITLDGEFLVFQWSADKSNSDKTLNAEIIDSETNQVLARGYNLSSGISYKTVVNAKEKSLKVLFTTKERSLQSIELTIGCTDSKEAQEVQAYVAPSLITRTHYTTSSNVPYNINGNQGQILASHTVTGTLARYLRVEFDDSTNGMDLLNIAYYMGGVDLGYYDMNMEMGDTYKPAMRFGGGQTVQFKMSTNSSNQGKATINVRQHIR